MVLVVAMTTKLASSVPWRSSLWPPLHSLMRPHHPPCCQRRPALRPAAPSIRPHRYTFLPRQPSPIRNAPTCFQQADRRHGPPLAAVPVRPNREWVRSWLPVDTRGRSVMAADRWQSVEVALVLRPAPARLCCAPQWKVTSEHCRRVR